MHKFEAHKIQKTTSLPALSDVSPFIISTSVDSSISGITPSPASQPVTSKHQNAKVVPPPTSAKEYLETITNIKLDSTLNVGSKIESKLDSLFRDLIHGFSTLHTSLSIAKRPAGKSIRKKEVPANTLVETSHNELNGTWIFNTDELFAVNDSLDSSNNRKIEMFTHKFLGMLDNHSTSIKSHNQEKLFLLNEAEDMLHNSLDKARRFVLII